MQAVDLLDAAVQRILTPAVANLGDFPSLATVLCAMIGIGVAEGSRLFDAALAQIDRVPAPLLAPAVMVAGLESSIAANAGFVVLVPLGAALYAQAGRSPVAGLATALAGVSAGYSANLDVLRDEAGTLAPLCEATVPLVARSFAAAGVAYGWASGRRPRVAEVPRAAAASVSTLGGYLVLAFAAAQVVAWLS